MSTQESTDSLLARIHEQNKEIYEAIERAKRKKYSPIPSFSTTSSRTTLEEEGEEVCEEQHQLWECK